MKSKLLLSGFIYALIGLLLMVQTNIVLAIASDEGNPITAAITAAINTITDTQEQPSPTPSPTPSSAPVSAPVTQSSPEPSSTPATSPLTSPVTEPSLTPSPTPSPIPTPVAPVINTISPNPATWGTHVVITGSNITNSVQIYLNNSLITPRAYAPASDDGTTITFTLPLFENYEANHPYKLYLKQDGLKSNEVDFTIAPSLAFNTTTPAAHQVSLDPQVNLDVSHNEVLIAYSNFNANISIPSSVTNPTLNFSDILIFNPYTNERFTSFNNGLTVNANTSLGTVKMEIPTSTQITGPGSWDGVINAPKILGPAGIKPTAGAGTIAMTSSVIEVGLGDTPLTFDKAVRILIPGQAGKLLGYQRGDNFTKITNNCSADIQSVGDSLPAGGECFISVGSDLVIWTKHFTKFVTYTQAPAPVPTNGNTNSSSTEAPICGDSKPVSAPKLISAKATGRNEVTLLWDKALDPVSYYLVVYGTKPGQPEYGNPNIGGKDTQTYVVKGLDTGKTYYFKVRAGNGCMPGELSNELAVKVLGDLISGPAKGFKSEVLSSNKADLKFKSITTVKPERVIKTNLLAKLFSLISRLFRS